MVSNDFAFWFLQTKYINQTLNLTTQLKGTGLNLVLSQINDGNESSYGQMDRQNLPGHTKPTRPQKMIGEIDMCQ